MDDSVSEIILTNGMVALVDSADYEYLARFRWRAFLNRGGRQWYAVRGRNDKWKPMHHAILPPPKGYLTDHKNGNGLDNRRENLRIATPSQNAQNRRKSSSNTSGYKGVVWLKKAKRWQASLEYKGHIHYLGVYLTAEDAAHAYDTEASRLWGEFASLNFPSKKLP